MSEQADIWVSVDFGNTFTGVAYKTSRNAIQIVRGWPGQVDEGENKVPTVLTYNADGSLFQWGFLCDDRQDLPGKIRYQLFKLSIEDDSLQVWRARGVANLPESAQQARRLVTDFLTKVYEHTKSSVIAKEDFQDTWESLAIRFVFSVPTTWKTPETRLGFEKAIYDAGFGKEGRRHSVDIGLNEAEAAAVTILKGTKMERGGGFGFQKDCVFMTVDAGGGTTDLTVMRKTSTDKESPRMAQALPVTGIGIGGALIDADFKTLVESRLAAWSDIEGPPLPPYLPTQMSRSKEFLRLKRTFGREGFDESSYSVKVDSLPNNYDSHQLGIVQGSMIFSRDEIQGLFDDQINGILSCIQEQLRNLTEMSSDQVEFVTLSGGLGSSDYVLFKLQKYFDNHFTGGKTIKVMRCEDPRPQLAVVHGLLLDNGGGLNQAPVLQSRKARANFGLAVKKESSRLKIQRDNSDPKQSTAYGVLWLIKKGDDVSTTDLKTHPLRAQFPPNEEIGSIKATIMTSELKWPASGINEASSHIKALTDFEVLLGEVEHSMVKPKYKRRFWFFKKHICNRVQFELRVTATSAGGFRFEAWIDGKKYSVNHSPVLGVQ